MLYNSPITVYLNLILAQKQYAKRKHLFMKLIVFD